MATLVKCPTCKREVEWSSRSPYRPFCSDRCRLVDLGGWLTEQHKIPDESTIPEQSPDESDAERSRQE